MSNTSLLIRRQVLGLLGGVGVAAATGTTACFTGRSVRLPNPIAPGSRVVVIGAGASGIGAAEKLIAAGYAVEMIEARDRMGGPAHDSSVLCPSMWVGPG